LKISSSILLCVILFVVVINIVSPYYFIPSGGSSMYPTTDCGVSVVDKNVNSYQESDIVIYKHTMKRFGVTSPNYVQHRIYDKDTEFDIKYSKFTVTKNNYFIKQNQNFFGIESKSVLYNGTYTNYSEAQQLENETIYITKGDNNPKVDPILLQKDDMVGEVIKIYQFPNLVCDGMNPLYDLI